MPAYNGVSAAVHVDGKPLDEYQVQQNDGKNEVSCWIPSHVGKEFIISAENTSLDKHMSLEVSLDGYEADCIYLRPQRQGTVAAFAISATEERPFLFSEGRLTDDDDLEGEMQDWDNLGTITLSFQEINGEMANRIVNEKNDGIPFGPVIPEQRLIPEREKKGIQTCVALGPVRAVAEYDEVHFEYISDVVTRMVFRYRPLDYLQAQGIAPRPPPPEPRPASPPPQTVATDKEVKRKRADDVESEAGPSGAKRVQTERKKSVDVVEISDDEDVNELQVLQARIDKILAKRNARVQKEIKAEPTVTFLEGEIIDLT